jgi:hypothetical protein
MVLLHYFRNRLPVAAVYFIERTTLDKLQIDVITDIGKHHIVSSIALSAFHRNLRPQLTKRPNDQNMFHEHLQNAIP